MIELTIKLDAPATPVTTVVLPLHKRIKSRQRVTLEDGRDAGILLERGSTLKDGDLLTDNNGNIIEVKAALETLSIVRSDDPLQLARACYHLGNRHMSIQIEANAISYLHDHVLDDMLRGFGLEVVVEQGPFEPEPGAYGGSATGHHHGHEHHESPHHH